MDLGAFIQIERLDHLAKANGISIPRLRGYRLMRDERPMGQDWYNQLMLDCEIDAIESLCDSDPFWSPTSNCSAFGGRPTRARHYYIAYGFDENDERVPVGIKWDKIHGKKRRILKFEIKKNKKKALAQYALWDKYAGQDHVLYIHSRMGGNNWKNYSDKDKIVFQPWFLDRVDDWWDGTYCDFYAKLDPRKYPMDRTSNSVQENNSGLKDTVGG